MAERKLTIIATKGTLDWAYPPFILASTAAALGMEVSIFFTFYGLNLLLKDTSVLKITPTATFRTTPFPTPVAVRPTAPRRRTTREGLG